MYRNSLIYFLSSFLSISINFATLPFFTRYLSLTDYGTIALFFMYGSIFGTFFSFGLSSALNRFYFKYHLSKFKIFFSTIIFSVLILFCLILLLTIPFQDFLNEILFKNIETNNLLLLSLINGSILIFYQFNKGLLINQKKPFTFLFCESIRVLFNIFVSFYLVFYEEFTYLGLIYGMLISNAISMIISFLIIRNILTFNISFNKLKESLILSYPETPNLMVQLLFASFDKLMLANVKGTYDVGKYDLSQKFSGILKMAQDSVSNVFTPLFMEAAESGLDEDRKNLKKF